MSILNLRLIIQKSVALSLLVIFAFSITPKRFLHDWVAGHRDGREVCHEKAANPHFHEIGIKCECDNFVADSPFDKGATIYISVIFQFGIAQDNSIPGKLFLNTAEVCFLRGPPHC